MPLIINHESLVPKQSVPVAAAQSEQPDLEQNWYMPVAHGLGEEAGCQDSGTHRG